MKHTRLYLFLIVLFLVSPGCTPSLRQTYLKQIQRPQTAERFFTELDRVIKHNKAQNVVYAPIPGFPYLRADRFAAGIKTQLDTDQKRRDWVDLLKTLDLEARKAEIQALSPVTIQEFFRSMNLEGPATSETLITHARTFGEALQRYDENQPKYVDALVASVDVPDDYSILMRTFGLYPLAYLPVAYFSAKAYDKIRAWHQKPPEAFPTLGEILTYSAQTQQTDPAFHLPDIYRESNLNALGLPRLTKSDEENLAYIFAPIILQDTVDTYDQIGRFEWQGSLPGLDLTSPTVYFYITHALMESTPILQINYAFWYTGRRGKKAPWFERGEFDGMTVRVSLDDRGTPFMVDIMNNCGCYHFFMPSASRIEAVKEIDFELDPLVPKWLPEQFPQYSLNVLVNSGWHQVENISAKPIPNTSKLYQLLPYDMLESLPLNDQQTVNLFDDEGIMKGSYRIEPYIFFSMGIPKVGYMRQRGHHPVQMLGREHFDDPFIFNRNFTFK